VTIISMDCFYKGLTQEQRADVKNYNFDHPAAFDYNLMVDILNKIRGGEPTEV